MVVYAVKGFCIVWVGLAQQKCGSRRRLSGGTRRQKCGGTTLKNDSPIAIGPWPESRGGRGGAGEGDW